MTTKNYPFNLKIIWNPDFDIIMIPTLLIRKQFNNIGIGFLFLKLKITLIFY